MGKRLRVVSATVLLLLGATVMVVPLLGGGSLHAAGFQAAGQDLPKLFLWIGLGALILSALLFVSASTD